MKPGSIATQMYISSLCQSNDALVKKFEFVQNHMIYLGMEKGLNHPDVIEVSQVLDSIHNEMLGISS